MSTTATRAFLRVAPRINANGNVLLNIEQEISAVADNANANTLTPTVSQRRVASSIAVANGQTVLLAGLISDTQNRSRSGIPGLDKIPGVGELFSQNNTPDMIIKVMALSMQCCDEVDRAAATTELLEAVTACPAGGLGTKAMTLADENAVT